MCVIFMHNKYCQKLYTYVEVGGDQTHFLCNTQPFFWTVKIGLEPQNQQMNLASRSAKLRRIQTKIKVAKISKGKK